MLSDCDDRHKHFARQILNVREYSSICAVIASTVAGRSYPSKSSALRSPLVDILRLPEVQIPDEGPKSESTGGL